MTVTNGSLSLVGIMGLSTPNEVEKSIGEFRLENCTNASSSVIKFL